MYYLRCIWPSCHFRGTLYFPTQVCLNSPFHPYLGDANRGLNSDNNGFVLKLRYRWLASLTYSVVLCQSWMKRLNFPTFLRVNVFLFFSFCALTNTALFPDCIVWFPYTVCGMNSEANQRALQSRHGCSFCLTHEHNDGRKGSILENVINWLIGDDPESKCLLKISALM